VLFAKHSVSNEEIKQGRHTCGNGDGSRDNIKYCAAESDHTPGGFEVGSGRCKARQGGARARASQRGKWKWRGLHAWNAAKFGQK
jgi:hypothetical protein